MTSANNEPWCLHPSKLETWYNENIQKGTTSFDTCCCEAVDDVVRSIHRICSKDGDMFKVSEIVKGGSLGKGTMVQNFSDVDLVAFINPPYLQRIQAVGPQGYRQQLGEVISKIEAEMRTASEKRSFQHRVEDISSSTYLVNFTIVVGDLPLKVDLLPTASIPPGVKDRDKDTQKTQTLFRTMLTQSSERREFYSVPFVKDQVKFVKRQPGCVKELIRLVKYWAYTNSELPEKLKKSYPLELITIFRWQRAGRPDSFDKAMGLKSVLLNLTSLSAFRTYWKGQYYKDVAINVFRNLPHTGPIMLDPVNPTNNVLKIYQEDDNVRVMKLAARRTLRSASMKKVVNRGRRQQWVKLELSN